MPKWIDDKGQLKGACVEVLTGPKLSITISNKVRFAGRVKELRVRTQWALDNRVRQMIKQLNDMALKGAAKRAGF